MPRESVSSLTAFVTVARLQSFTKAAAHLRVSQSALSHSIRGLEERLDIRLLNRTSRNVSPTEAGLRLLHSIGPHLDEIEKGLAELISTAEAPKGTVRITSTEHAAETILWPAVERVLSRYPDITVEISIDAALVDIVESRFDAGIRLGESVAQDMIAVRISPDIEMAAVASPAYFAENSIPETPQDLVRHRCINLRLETAGGLYPWEFEMDGREVKVHAEGNLIFNTSQLRIKAALAGLGITYITEDQVRELVADGRLVRVLTEWCPPFPGYHLYYPSRRQSSVAFRLLLNALRYKDH